MATNSSNDSGHSHVIQKTGLLKTYSVVKTISVNQLEKLKAQAKARSKTDAEYEQALSNLLSEFKDMHGGRDAVPGVIHTRPRIDRRVELVAEAGSLLRSIKKGKKSKDEVAFLISSLIQQLKLTKEDFKNIGVVKDDAEDDSDDDSDEDSED